MATAGATLSLAEVFLSLPSARDVCVGESHAFPRHTERSVEQDEAGSTEHVLKQGDFKYHS